MLLLRWMALSAWLWFPLVALPSAPAQETIRVGVYLNPPLSFPDLNGKPGGFIVDLLGYIAKQQGWALHYAPCNWDECHELLALGEIDMLAPVSAKEARSRGLDHNRESLYVNWGQIVTAEEGELNSPLDLEGKTVVALSSDVHFADIKELAQRFDIHTRFLEVSDYESVLAWVAEGPADAGLVSRSFDIDAFPHYPVVRSSVIFNPAEIRIALSPRNDSLQNAIRIQRIDRELTALKGDHNSIYYQLQERWFGRKTDAEIPRWVLWLLGVVLGVALLLAAGVLLLRQQVRRRTVELRQINGRFTAFMNNLPGIAYMKGADGRYIFVNPVWKQTKQLNDEQVVGRLPADIWPSRGLGTHMPEERLAIEKREIIESIESSPWDDQGRIWRLIRFPMKNSDPSGSAIMVGGIGVEVTDQKRAEDRLSHLNRQLQLLLESAGDGIFGVDGLGRCTFINPAALMLLGYSRDEVIGSRIHDLIEHSHPDGSSFPENESPIRHAFSQGEKSRTDDGLFWRADGRSIRVEYSAYPMREAVRLGAVVVFRQLAGEEDE
jgi:PAS domain S-box-containing protein